MSLASLLIIRDFYVRLTWISVDGAVTLFRTSLNWLHETGCPFIPESGFERIIKKTMASFHKAINGY